jgi:osmoprotectant transport system permease protein
MIEVWKYMVSHAAEIIDQAIEHLQLTIGSMAIASVIGIAVGVLIAHHKRYAKPILGFVGIIQTIPSLALLGFLLPLFGIGKVPAIIALFLYALLPIVRNTYVGITEVNQSVKEAAVGMGMTRFQLLRYVEIPIAFPVILAGIKTSTVINVGVATLCAYIGAGGLGEFIFRGISLNNANMILAGAIPASLLAILLDFALGIIKKNYRNKWWLLGIGSILLVGIFGGQMLRNKTTQTYKLTAGFNSEFIEREDGFKGLDSIYNLPLAIREMEIGLMYKSLHQGEVDIIDGFSTDGRIKAYNLKLLDDDQDYFPPYFAAPIIHQNTLAKYPELLNVFEKLEGLISDVEMAELNYQIDFEKKELREVAYSFLIKNNLSASFDAGRHNDAHLIIGSKAFTENYLLAYLFAQLIEGQTRLKTRLQLGFGGTKLVFDALNTHEIDLYPEYTGTGLLVILKAGRQVSDSLKSPLDVYHYVNRSFQEQYDICWLPPLGFDNNFALMMRQKMADSLHIRTLSELSDFLNE